MGQERRLKDGSEATRATRNNEHIVLFHAVVYLLTLSPRRRTVDRGQKSVAYVSDSWLTYVRYPIASQSLFCRTREISAPTFSPSRSEIRVPPPLVWVTRDQVRRSQKIFDRPFGDRFKGKIVNVSPRCKLLEAISR